MQYLLVAGFVVLVLILAWQLPSPSHSFVIRIRNGVPALTRGKVAQTFLADVADILQRYSIRRGSIFGLRRRGTINLDFSRSIPANCRQSLRNVWSMHVH